MIKPNLLVIGSLNMDIVVELDRSPEVGETIQGKKVSFLSGGKGANQAVAGARLGANVAMIGAVGGDSFGDTLLKGLAADQVNIAGVKTIPELTTGIASIQVANQDNSIVVVAGANDAVQPTFIDEYKELLLQADIVLLQLEIPVETVLYAARKAKELGKKVVLNPAPACEIPDELFRLADYVTPNRTELAWYTSMDTEGEALGAAMKRLKEMGAAHVITTLGADGSAYLDHEGNVQIIPAHKLPVVDTTGAGDCYNAAFAYSIAAGQSLEEAIQYASLASALSVTKFGAAAGMPTAEEVRAFADRR